MISGFTQTVTLISLRVFHSPLVYFWSIQEYERSKQTAQYLFSHEHTDLSGGWGDARSTAVQYCSQLVLSVILNLVESQLTIVNETHQNGWIAWKQEMKTFF